MIALTKNSSRRRNATGSVKKMLRCVSRFYVACRARGSDDLTGRTALSVPTGMLLSVYM